MATATYIDSVNPSLSGAVHTASGASIGTADTNRLVIVAMTTPTFRSLASASIAGVSVSPSDIFQSNGNGFVAIFFAVVPTGATGTIIATMNDTDFFSARFHIFTVDNTTVDLSSAVAYANGESTGQSNDVTYTGVTGAIKISAIGFSNGGSKTPVQLNGVNATENNSSGSANLVNSWASGGTDAWTWDFTSTASRAITFILPEAGGGGGGLSIPIAMKHLRNQGIA